MNFANTKRLLTLWLSAFICAFSLHLAVGAQFYFYNTGVRNSTLSSPIMLTFAQETFYPDVNTDLSDINTDLSNISTEPEVLQPHLSGQESKILESVDEIQQEESHHHMEQDDFATLKSLQKSLSQKEERNILAEKPIPKTVVKQSTVKTIRSSTTTQGGNAVARENALLVEWLAKVQAQLERQKEYVVGQRISRAKGTVKLEFRVHEQGHIFSSRVVVSAGDRELDRLAMTALQRVGTFPPPPPSKVNKIIRVSLIFS
ncbi:protein TonB [Bartonella callosciuri]|uniref:Protein TonB n=1 Tax=Bartonella callosciuri TaxID=686223 RepID=A0A840NT51_9HYPH|nr:TonB family protein [Bartonella callosciuri]MBB5073578.1 protein TonB [Bartonella callosciuri]